MPACLTTAATSVGLQVRLQDWVPTAQGEHCWLAVMLLNAGLAHSRTADAAVGLLLQCGSAPCLAVPGLIAGGCWLAAANESSPA